MWFKKVKSISFRYHSKTKRFTSEWKKKLLYNKVYISWKELSLQFSETLGRTRGHAVSSKTRNAAFISEIKDKKRSIHQRVPCKRDLGHVRQSVLRSCRLGCLPDIENRLQHLCSSRNILLYNESKPQKDSSRSIHHNCTPDLDKIVCFLFLFIYDCLFR